MLSLSLSSERLYRTIKCIPFAHERLLLRGRDLNPRSLLGDLAYETSELDQTTRPRIISCASLYVASWKLILSYSCIEIDHENN